MFNLKQYGVSTTFSEGGSIDPAFRLVDHGGSTTFTVVADEGFSIDQVSGCGGSLSNGTFTTGPITAECNIEAVFLINQYTVLASAGENGTISPSSTTVDHGKAATFTVIPDVGYQVETIGGCGGALEDSIYTTASIVADCQVGVSFAPLTTVGQWSVNVLGRIDGYSEIYPVQIAEDGSALIGIAMRLDGATGQYVSQGFVWREDIGIEPLMLADDQAYANSISADGMTAFGQIGSYRESRGFVWRYGLGIEPFEIDGGSGISIDGASRDGSVAWGQYEESGTIVKFLWTEVEGARRFFLEGSPAVAHAATPDGNVIVGSICEQYVGCRAMRWNRLNGTVDRFRVEGDTSAMAVDVSDDGSIVVGHSSQSSSNQRGFVWTPTGGIQALMPSGSSWSNAREVSADGSTVLGEHSGPDYRRLYTWKLETGFQDVMVDNDSLSRYFFPTGPSISSDGSQAIGISCLTLTQQGCVGFIWVDQQGIVSLFGDDRESNSVGGHEMSRDGRVVGFAEIGAFTWTIESGVEPLIIQPPAFISGDGSTITGLLCNVVTCELVLLKTTN